MSGLHSLVASAAFWQAVLAVVVGFAAIPGGIVQTLLESLLAALEAWLHGRLPATEYAVVKVLAEDAVKYAWQKGGSYAWTNDQKKQTALDFLTKTVDAHGYKAFDANVLSGVIESVYADLKPVLATKAAVTTTPTVTAPAAPASSVADKANEPAEPVDGAIPVAHV